MSPAEQSLVDGRNTFIPAAHPAQPRFLAPPDKYRRCFSQQGPFHQSCSARDLL